MAKAAANFVVGSLNGSPKETIWKPVNPIITLDRITVRRYYSIVIRSFADKETGKVFQRYFSRKLPPEIQHTARVKLEIPDAAEVLQDLRIPTL